MTRLLWNVGLGYEIGLDRGVFYPKDGPAEVWNGLVSVNQAETSLRDRVRYRDGRKVVNRRAEDSFAATVQAFTYPPSFLMHPRVPFGFSYRIMMEEGYQIHLVYNALAHMTERSYGQEGTTPLSFDLSTRPLAVPHAKPSAHLVIDSKVAYPAALAEFENAIYGIDGPTAPDARLPMPSEVMEIFELNAIFQVIDNGDGTFTIDGPDEAIHMLDGTTFTISWPSAVYVDEESYTVRTF